MRTGTQFKGCDIFGWRGQQLCLGNTLWVKKRGVKNVLLLGKVKIPNWENIYPHRSGYNSFSQIDFSLKCRTPCFSEAPISSNAVQVNTSLGHFTYKCLAKPIHCSSRRVCRACFRMSLTATATRTTWRVPWYAWTTSPSTAVLCAGRRWDCLNPIYIYRKDETETVSLQKLRQKKKNLQIWDSGQAPYYKLFEPKK